MTFFSNFITWLIQFLFKKNKTFKKKEFISMGIEPESFGWLFSTWSNYAILFSITWRLKSSHECTNTCTKLPHLILKSFHVAYWKLFIFTLEICDMWTWIMLKVRETWKILYLFWLSQLIILSEPSLSLAHFLNSGLLSKRNLKRIRMTWFKWNQFLLSLDLWRNLLWLTSKHQKISKNWKVTIPRCDPLT